MSKPDWTFLSYTLSNTLSGYGDGKRIDIIKIRSQENGDSSNNTEISLPSHYGTHVDFPLHFSLNGKSLNDYKAEDFVFRNVTIIDFCNVNISGYLITVKDLKEKILTIDNKTDFLLIKTGFCEKRNTSKYWEYGLGFDIGTADFIKSKFPNIKAIGFDLISLNSYQKREVGRVSHVEYLIKNDILIVEDMNLSKINSQTQIEQLILAPLRFENAEGTPVTIIAKTIND